MKVKILLRKADVIERFKTQQEAGNAIGVTKVAVGLWGDYVPQASAWAYVALYPNLPHKIQKNQKQAA